MIIYAEFVGWDVGALRLCVDALAVHIADVQPSYLPIGALGGIEVAVLQNTFTDAATAARRLQTSSDVAHFLDFFQQPDARTRYFSLRPGGVPASALRPGAKLRILAVRVPVRWYCEARRRVGLRPAVARASRQQPDEDHEKRCEPTHENDEGEV